jgi:hypothetical protein
VTATPDRTLASGTTAPASSRVTKQQLLILFVA